MVKSLRIVSLLLVFVLTITAFSACGPKTPSVSGGEEDFYYQNFALNISTRKITVRFGLLNRSTNLFEPGEEIPYYLTLKGPEFEGKSVAVTFKNNEFAVDETKNHLIEFGEDGVFEARGTFKGSNNGVYTLQMTVAGIPNEMSFDVGVVPKAKQANDNFLFGMQPYYTHLSYSASRRIDGLTIEDSKKAILDTIEWLGCNLIREEGVSWSNMQPTADATMDFSKMDQDIDAFEARNMKLIWIIGHSTEWAVMQKYASKVSGNTWAYPPEKKYWDARLTAIANHYKDRDSIIYEIWNEADWEFFKGTEEEYLALLDSACRILKGANKNNFVIPSALVSNWETALNPEVFAKDSMKYYSKYKELYDLGLIDTVNIHAHALFIPDTFFASVQRLQDRLERAKFTKRPEKIIVSEAGIWSKEDDPQAAGLMSKILWYRANGYGGHVAYAFRPEAAGRDDNLTWEMFDSHLQPRKSAIAYATLINFIGNSEFKETIPAERDYTFADIYYNEGKSIIPLYAVTDHRATLNIKTNTPYKVYDIYGNEGKVKDTNAYDVNKAVTYLVFDGKVTPADFSWR